MKIDIEIPKDLKPAQRDELADLVVEHIVERTQKGLDKKGRQFKAYKKSYIDSLDFAIAGKSAGRVDLQLSGDMLASLVALSHKNGSIKVGFERGDEVNGRAEGHITGVLGKTRGRKRDFLGIQKSELNKLVKYVREHVVD